MELLRIMHLISKRPVRVDAQHKKKSHTGELNVHFKYNENNNST